MGLLFGKTMHHKTAPTISLEVYQQKGHIEVLGTMETELARPAAGGGLAVFGMRNAKHTSFKMPVSY